MNDVRVGIVQSFQKLLADLFNLRAVRNAQTVRNFLRRHHDRIVQIQKPILTVAQLGQNCRKAVGLFLCQGNVLIDIGGLEGCQRLAGTLNAFLGFRQAIQSEFRKERDVILCRFGQSVIGRDELVDHGNHGVHLVYAFLRDRFLHQLIEMMNHLGKVGILIEIIRHLIHIAGQIARHAHHVALRQLCLLIDAADIGVVILHSRILHELRQLRKIRAVRHDGIEVVKDELPRLFQFGFAGGHIRSGGDIKFQHLVADFFNR